MENKIIYTASTTQEFVKRTIKNGWECVKLNDNLDCANLVLISPYQNNYNYIIKYCNSGWTIEKAKIFPQSILKEIENVKQVII